MPGVTGHRNQNDGCDLHFSGPAPASDCRGLGLSPPLGTTGMVLYNTFHTSTLHHTDTHVRIQFARHRESMHRGSGVTTVQGRLMGVSTGTFDANLKNNSKKKKPTFACGGRRVHPCGTNLLLGACGVCCRLIWWCEEFQRWVGLRAG